MYTSSYFRWSRAKNLQIVFFFLEEVYTDKSNVCLIYFLVRVQM